MREQRALICVLFGHFLPLWITEALGRVAQSLRCSPPVVGPASHRLRLVRLIKDDLFLPSCWVLGLPPDTEVSTLHRATTTAFYGTPRYALTVELSVTAFQVVALVVTKAIVRNLPVEYSSARCTAPISMQRDMSVSFPL